LATAVDSTFDGAPGVVAAILCWAAWGIGAVALLAPRPLALTVVRALAPASAALAGVAVATGAVDGAPGWVALGATTIAALLVADPALAIAAANAVAYGDERRYPLRTPPALFLGPLPVVRLAVAAGVVAPLLLLAAEHIAAGIVTLVAAAVVVPLGGRALHGLSRRWIVLVPAGVVVVDPLTLADPTLFTREHVHRLAPAEDGTPLRPDALDLRLGATLGALAITLDEPADLLRAGAGRRGGRMVKTDHLVVAVTRRTELLADAATRRVRVQIR
jgi:hypothetical protein